MAKWNDWFNALIYLNDRDKYPLQLILRDILTSSEDKSLNQAMLRDAKNSVSSLGFKSRYHGRRDGSVDYHLSICTKILR